MERNDILEGQRSRPISPAILGLTLGPSCALGPGAQAFGLIVSLCVLSLCLQLTQRTDNTRRRLRNPAAAVC